MSRGGWQEIFFEGIDQAAKLARLKNLREVRLEPEDFEVRIWTHKSRGVCDQANGK